MKMIKCSRLWSRVLLTMNVGNFLSYIPVRTFASHADMATVVRALAISPWWLIVMPGLLIAAALLGYIAYLLPHAARYFYARHRPGQAMLVLVCCGTVFGFYASAGFSNYGLVALALSRICVWVLLPLSVVGVALRLKYLDAADPAPDAVLQ